MRILVTNDDGINADGLAVLEEIAAGLGGEIWVVAPESEQSGASRSLSLSQPLRVREHGNKRFSVQGTPADCVLMAVRHLMPEVPELILSGVNRGQNIADDVTYSGTIAAAMEGTALGIRSIALSQSYAIESGLELRWQVAAHHGVDVVRKVQEADWGEGVLVNINFPDCQADEVKGYRVTRQGKRDQNLMRIEARRDLRGRDYFWLGFRREQSDPPEGTDLRAVYSRQISITPLHMNLTHEAAIERLRQVFDEVN